MAYLNIPELQLMNTWNSAECEICHRLLPRDNVAAHYNLHCVYGNRSAPPKKTFGCESCGTSFVTRKILERHEQCRHRPLKPYLCGQCRNRHFANRGALIQHVYRKHFRTPTQQELEHSTPQSSCPACNLAVLGSSTHMLKHRVTACRCRSLLQKRHVKRITRLAASTGIDPLRYVSLELEAWLLDKMLDKAHNQGCSVMVSPGGCFQVVKQTVDDRFQSSFNPHARPHEGRSEAYACRPQDMDDVFVGEVLGDRFYGIGTQDADGRGLSLENLEQRQMDLLYLMDMWDQDVIKTVGAYDVRMMEKMEKLSSKIHKKPYKVAERLAHTSLRNGALLSQLLCDNKNEQKGTVVLPSVAARLEDELNNLGDREDESAFTINPNLAAKLEREADLVDSLIESKSDTKVNLMDVLIMNDNQNIIF